MNVLVTGAKGFIGKNLMIALRRVSALVVWEYDVGSTLATLEEGLANADVVFHLAGVNRPEQVEEYETVNVELTRQVCDILRGQKRRPVFVLPSSTQAVLDNPYGLSKRKAEEAVLGLGQEMDTAVFVYRLPGVFGKWCRPNYNSVVATFCHNIARDLPVSVSDPEQEIELVYIDDVVKAFVGILNGDMPTLEGEFCRVAPSYRIKLGKLAETIYSFRESRLSLILPHIANRFIACLYATYLSYLPTDDFAYALKQNVDQRGELAELIKSAHFGQIFVSRTRAGIVRGNHYHDTKVEKFAILEGEAVIRFRHILEDDVIEYPVSGKSLQVVDIPPGYTHSIENVGKTDLIVLFWANEIFHPMTPDTYPAEVEREET